MNHSENRTPPIAIIGISALFPGAITTMEFWRDILEGRDRLIEVPRTHFLRDDYFDARPGTPDKIYATRGGFLPEVEFSPLEFGLPPNTLPSTDTAQLLALLVAKRALIEATRGRLEEMDRSRMSVVLGVASATELVAHMAGRLQLPVAERAMRAAGLDEEQVARVREILAGCYVPWTENTFPGLLGNVVAGRIANRLDLGGTNTVIDAACASSLAAVDVAINELAVGHADLVVTGGVDTLNDILMFMCFAQTGALSLTGDCRPFAADADGTMLGEGIGMLVLKRLADAERDGDPVYAVIRGVGSSSDGRAKSIYAPLPAGQALALRRAYERAGYGPDSVGLVEAHGTATKAGDAAEFEALKDVFETAGAPQQRCALGSIKGQIGHTKAAAGAAGLIKAVMALHHRILPKTIKVKAPNPGLGMEESPFYLNTETRPWVHAADHPRRASVSALGFGGTNFHITLEEYRGPAPHPGRLRTAPTELVLLSAPDPKELAALCRETAERCAAPGSLVHLAKRTQLAFACTAPSRLAIVAADEADLMDKLRSAAASIEKNRGAPFSSPNGIHFSTGSAAGPVAFLFPGQGSQYVGMGRDLAVHFEHARGVWDRAAALSLSKDEQLTQLVFPVPAFTEEAKRKQDQRLTATEWAQPSIVAASLSMLRIVERLGLSPICLGGHSLGEVTALGAAGAFDELAAVTIARRRGELFIGHGSPGGAMTAVAADRSTLERLISRWGCDVVVANHNAPGQVVLSGPTAAIDEVERRLAGEMLVTRRLAVSMAFHSPMLGGAHAPFRAFLDGVTVGAFRVPVYSNAAAGVYPEDAAAVRELLAESILRPVRFVEQIEAMYSAGARTFIEVGPDAVLTKLVSRCLDGRSHLAVALDQRGKHGVTALWDALGRLSAAGVKLDFSALWEGETLPEDPSNRVPSKLSVRLSGANFGKPLPVISEPPRVMTKPALSVNAQSPPAPKPVQPIADAVSAPDAPPPRTPTSAPAIPAVATLPAGSPADAAAALHLIQQIQAPVMAAQMEYQRLMAESHTAFLRAVEASYLNLGQAVGAAAPMPDSPTAVLSVSPRIPSMQPAEPEPPLVMAPPPSMKAAPMRAVPDPVSPTPAASAPVDLAALVLAVVADKTGYPVEMIELTMDLEAELGIDSIKRVEILSAVRERVPGAPEVDTARMATLRTLGEIIGVLASTPSTAPAAPEKPVADTSQTLIGPTGSAGASAEIGRFAVRAIAAPPLGFAVPGLFGKGVVAVTADGGGVARALTKRLCARGISAVAVETVPVDATAVVFLGGLRAVGAIEDALAVNRDAFAAARSIAARLREQGGAFVTVQDTGGDFGISGACGDRAWLAGLGALAKTAAAEWPLTSVRAIDIEHGGRDDEALADALAAELLHGGTEAEVGLRSDGTRVSIATVAAPPIQPDRPIPKGTVFVVSGGARGVTAASLIELSRACSPRLLILGRTALEEEPAVFHTAKSEAELKRAALEEAKRTGIQATPSDIARRVERVVASREIRETLRLLKAAGAEVRYVAADVRDPASIVPILEEVRSTWGPIRGLVHGAGVLSDALLDKKTDAQFDRVFDTKVVGLRALLDATSGDPLEWIALFSSVAARAGNAGQADYAMANEVLNKVAAVEARRRGDRCRVVSIGWGPWEGGMVTPSLHKHFEARGIKLLPLDVGASAFVRELSGSGEVDVVIGGNASLGPSAARSLRAEVLVDPETAPQLVDHRIQGRIVLPVVMVLEWFARLVGSDGDRQPMNFRDLRVVRGVVLSGYESGGDRLRLIGTPQPSGGAVALELRDADGALRYQATFDPSPFPEAVPVSAQDLAASPWSAGDYYGSNTLFHGPAFQVLKRIEGISAQAAGGVLAGVRSMGWPQAGWRTDPAALDGALQLAILFGRSAGRGPTLPVKIERVVSYATAEHEQIHCQLSLRHQLRECGVYDLLLVGADGTRVADLIGVEMFNVPSGTTAN